MLVKHPLKLPRGPVQFVTVDRNKALKTANLEAAATDMEPRVILMIFSLNSLQYKLHIRWWQNGQGWKAYPLSQETFKANFNFILLGTTIWIGKSSRHVRYKFLLSSLKHFFSQLLCKNRQDSKPSNFLSESNSLCLSFQCKISAWSFEESVGLLYLCNDWGKRVADKESLISL